MSSFEQIMIGSSPMQHTKFLDNRPTGSGEGDFEGFLPYMGMAAFLVM